jgi:hypothetical protein
MFCNTEQAMISSFGDKRTAAIFLGKVFKGLPVEIANSARLKLRMLHAARSLADLRNPPKQPAGGFAGRSRWPAQRSSQ